ncbi:unnamed protein product [Blepharisma stoltei]|uniref:Dickkopf N-terminal cysteine-rich domain-containing protein n=1 Tax=Blepharisma stoltei TaxID=1481888 RepID=A0AAU9K878_9CILI|nr:unnamed protein product [Blepharisma stoltei]
MVVEHFIIFCSLLGVGLGFFQPVLKDEGLQCANYTCKPSSMQFTNTTCAFYDNSGEQPVFYAHKCQSVKAPFCYTSFIGNSTCIRSPTAPLHTAWPGEKCSYTEDCSSHAVHGCLNGVCQGSELNESCLTHDDCNPGLRCLNQTCQPQLPVGGVGCSTDNDCVNGAGCNPSFDNPSQHSACYPYFSISNHFPVGDCSAINTNFLCNSGICQTYGTVYECMNPVKSPTLPNKCQSGFDCLSTQDPYFKQSQLIGQCVCGYNKDAQSYCSLFPGDDLAQKAMKSLVKWIQSTGIQKCNTNRRFNSACIQDYWGKRDYIDYMYYSLSYQLYPLLVDAEDCVQQTFLAGYYQAKKEYFII